MCFEDAWAVINHDISQWHFQMNTFIGPDNYISKSVIYLRCWHIVPDVGFRLWLTDCSRKLPWHFKKHLLQTPIQVKNELWSLNVSNAIQKLKVFTLASSESMKAEGSRIGTVILKVSFSRLLLLTFQNTSRWSVWIQLIRNSINILTL